MIGKSVREFLKAQRLGYVATVSDKNMPNLSPKGTVIAWDSKRIAFADIRSPTTIKNLSLNPNLEINVVDPVLRKGFRFAGRARVLCEGETFERILAYYRQEGVKSAIERIVLVDVSEMSEITSPVYDLGISEDEVKSKWDKSH